MLWDFVVALIGWAARIVFSPTVWFGLSLLGVCVVLWVVGGVLARRSAVRKIAARSEGAGAPSGSARASAPKAVVGGRTPATAGGKPAGRQAAPVDDDMAEIEALLKKRGIQ